MCFASGALLKPLPVGVPHPAGDLRIVGIVIHCQRNRSQYSGLPPVHLGVAISKTKAAGPIQVSRRCVRKTRCRSIHFQISIIDAAWIFIAENECMGWLRANDVAV